MKNVFFFFKKSNKCILGKHPFKNIKKKLWTVMCFWNIQKSLKWVQSVHTYILDAVNTLINVQKTFNNIESYKYQQMFEEKGCTLANTYYHVPCSCNKNSLILYVALKWDWCMSSECVYIILLREGASFVTGYWSPTGDWQTVKLSFFNVRWILSSLLMWCCVFWQCLNHT